MSFDLKFDLQAEINPNPNINKPKDNALQFHITFTSVYYKITE